MHSANRNGRLSRRRLHLAAAIAAASLAGAQIAAAVIAAPRTKADVVTQSVNALRDGWDPHEPGLSPSVLSSGTFGKLFSTAVNGQVFAQPVVAGSTVIVATQNDFVYGLDAASGAIKWSRSLGAPWPTSVAGCPDVQPNVGVMSTPVYDAAKGIVYLVAEVVPPGSDDFHPAFYLHALNAQTGKEQSGWPVRIHGAPVNDPTRPFNAYAQWQRAGLLELGGSVYAGFGSHCDFLPYDGYVAGVNTATRKQTMWTDESGVTDRQAGIWQGGGGLMSDGAGRIFVSTGNGVSPAPGPGSAAPPELGDSVVRLGVSAGGALSPRDFFSPANAPALDTEDLDLGSGGPIALPYGTASLPHLLVQAAKDGRIFTLNRDHLGGREQGPNGTDNVVSMAGPFRGEYGHPAAFGGTTTVTAANSASASDFLYYVGSNDMLRALKFGLNARGTPVFTDVANSAGTFGFSSGSPLVTSSGTAASSAVVWEVFSSGAGGGGGTLEAYRAVPPASCTSTAMCTLAELWSAPLGAVSKFSVPATDNGRVYVGTKDGHVLGFGSPDATPLTGASPVSFGDVAVASTSAVHDVTITASTSVTITAIAASSASGPDPFAAGTPVESGSPVTLPVTLTAGQQLTVPATMKPTAPGGRTGALTFSTNAANFPAVSVSLSGNGTEAGFYAMPASVSFGSEPVHTAATASVIITNGGTTAETVSSVHLPGSPFSVTGLPSGTIPAGTTVTATVRYEPAAVRKAASSLVIRAADGTTLTVPVSGTGEPDVSALTPAKTAVSFGSVPLGTQARLTIKITNKGNLPATITSASAPAVPFGNPSPVAKNLPLNPGYDLVIPLTYTPTSIGASSGSYRVRWSDAAGPHALSVPVTGTGIAPASGIAVPGPGGGWTLNGSAAMSGTTLSLTQLSQFQQGSAVYSVPEPSNGLSATFAAQLGGGTGGDGLTMSLLDARRAGPASLGGGGAELGYGGLPGVAVTLVTHRAPGEPSANFIGIATGLNGSVPKFAATSSAIPSLRTGRHVIKVHVSGQTITVFVDGKRVLSPTLRAGTIPLSVRVAFTAGSGVLTDNHQIIRATISAGSGSKLPPPGGGWSYNGSAGMGGSATYLTRAVPSQAGSVVYPVPVRTSGLRVQFNLQMFGGNGGFGITFALLNPSSASATSVGAGGAELGFGGLNGSAVALVSSTAPGYPAGNFAGISTGVSGSVLSLHTYATNISPLRSGTHTVSVQITAGKVMIVFMDGEQLMQEPLPRLPATALIAFTAGTGTSTDDHVIRNVAISATG